MDGTLMATIITSVSYGRLCLNVYLLWLFILLHCGTLPQAYVPVVRRFNFIVRRTRNAWKMLKILSILRTLMNSTLVVSLLDMPQFCASSNLVGDEWFYANVMVMLNLTTLISLVWVNSILVSQSWNVRKNENFVFSCQQCSSAIYDQNLFGK